VNQCWFLKMDLLDTYANQTEKRSGAGLGKAVRSFGKKKYV
jgi:hypothetical protein